MQYQLYPLDSCCVFPPITKRHKELIARHVIALLQQVNVIQMVNKVVQFHNWAANNLCNLLTDQSIEFLVDRKIIKGVHHINILINYITHIFTKEIYYISTLDFQNLDDIATKFMDYDYNEITRTKQSNNDSNQSETQYPSAKKNHC